MRANGGVEWLPPVTGSEIIKKRKQIIVEYLTKNYKNLESY